MIEPSYITRAREALAIKKPETMSDSTLERALFRAQLDGDWDLLGQLIEEDETRNGSPEREA